MGLEEITKFLAEDIERAIVILGLIFTILGDIGLGSISNKWIKYRSRLFKIAKTLDQFGDNKKGKGSKNKSGVLMLFLVCLVVLPGCNEFFVSLFETTAQTAIRLEAKRFGLKFAERSSDIETKTAYAYAEMLETSSSPEDILLAGLAEFRGKISDPVLKDDIEDIIKDLGLIAEKGQMLESPVGGLDPYTIQALKRASAGFKRGIEIYWDQNPKIE
jgi:hypothetical protein